MEKIMMHKVRRVDSGVSLRYLLETYNWYSPPHKYVRGQLYNFMERVGKTNFTDPQSLAVIKESFNNIKNLLAGHARHEDSAYHPLLKSDPELLSQAENEHKALDEEFDQLERLFNLIQSTNMDNQQRVLRAHEFYLKFSAFFAGYMRHLVQEETKLMAAMRSIHGVQKLRETVTFNTYHHMSQDDMVGMLEHLFTNLNTQEKAVMLFDIYDSDFYHQAKEDYSAKFPFVWQEIQRKNILTAAEIELLNPQFPILHSIAEAAAL